MNTTLLRFLDLFRWLYQRLGVDYEQLRSIVDIKLTMDSRRQIVSYNRKASKEPSNAFVKTLIVYCLFGIFVALALYFIPSFILSLIVFFSYIIVMIAMTLITDFSSILLDTSDNTIILPRPVNGQTLFAARLTHILLYLGQLAIGLSILPAVVIIIKYGFVLFLCFLVATTLSVLTAVFLTNSLYLVIMQFASEEKLKNIINYFQIMMAVFIMGGYQILPRLMERMDIKNYVFETQWYHFLLPPVWMAGALESIHFHLYDSAHIALLFCAVVLPVAGAYVVNKYLSPVFSRKLGSMGAGTEKVEKDRKEKESFIERLSSYITTNPMEQGAFDLIYKILGRDRKIKLKVYPSFGYVIIFGLIFMMQGKKDIVETWHNLPNTEYHIMLIYLTFMVLQVALHEIPYSDDFKASWVYFSTPIDKPGEILSGTLKAVFVRLFIPGYVGISILILAIWGIRAADDILFGFFNNAIMLLILALINKRELPFSIAPNLRSQSGNVARAFIAFLIIGILGFGHYLLSKWPSIQLGTIAVQIGLIFLLLRSYKRTGWSSITL
ncbi:hypothetical protein ACFQ21_10710 [Ohtaekwangia kribbensis]|uniref:ABC transporter permease n=1 Tax=Ohtaekwangia kribbensis TaxID=688913 RepID=A0ABW3K0L3_9BACT